MKQVLCYLTMLLLFSCVSNRKLMDSFIGKDKQAIIMRFGLPDRTGDDGNGGEVLVYAQRQYGQLPNGTFLDVYEYRFFHIDDRGYCYYWRMNTQPNPPQRVQIEYVRPPRKTVVTGYE